MDAQSRIDRIEATIQRDVGRGMDAVFKAARGGLAAACRVVAALPAPRIGIITGFYVPSGDPPAAETDGPAGAALLTRGLIRAGLSCRWATDTLCAQACRAALDAAGVPGVVVDAAAPQGEEVADVTDAWRREGIDIAIAIERAGPAKDGAPRNMRGRDLTDYVAPLDRLFRAGPWRTIAVGDGGNELGMGSIPAAAIARHVPNGESIACAVPADTLVAAGVSHWGAYALLAGLALLRPDWAEVLLQALDADLDAAVVEAMVRLGPAVDGVLATPSATIDALGMEVHRRMMAEVRDLAHRT